MAKPFDPRTFKSVSEFLRGVETGSRSLETRIHPADEMYGFEIQARNRTPEAAALLYFSTGHLIVRSVDEIFRWRFPRTEDVTAFLDFGSGYGRTTRFLARILPPDRITVAEIDIGAVRFQEQMFGVRGVVSGKRPDDLRLGGAFDAILAVSFFSHLSAARFEGWLARLYSHLAPGGLLIFSVHGMELLPEPGADRSAGIVFRPVSETKRLDGEDYGTSYVTPEFVEAAAKRATGGACRLLGFPGGLAGYQDLHVLVRPPWIAASDLRLARAPLGALDRAEVRGGVVSVEGWAGGASDESPPRVRLVLDGAVTASSPGEGAPGSRRRWSFRFPTAAVSPDAIVRVEAESEKGLSRILVAETLRPYL